ncbi:ADP-ribose pyrophosphatase [Rhodovulum iodosum]|uniref:ADP-ribose pyrophosphatase n=1 Tax=Rhodovulum iodosum TaxID=68291 RepID=A0ABV3XTZ8_9RHOB|nr:NUDIX domain-containing protein [Rhodovulum robiginosum]RSK32012.1 NUDIX domain-containing protein [Rhodovulum robiginosum]
METVFLYGTLCHLPLLSVVLGRPEAALDAAPARAEGYRVDWVAGESYPMIRPAEGHVAEGLVLSGLDAEARARLDYYEGGFGFRRAPVTVTTAQGPAEAAFYAPRGNGLVPGAPWRLADWAARWGELCVLAAEEVMARYGEVPPQQIARRVNRIRVRAEARRKARSPSPTTLRRATRPDDIALRERREPYAKFFAVEEYEFRHRRFDGGMSEEVNRAAFISGDAATVLPYDPARDTVLLIEQFRTGPYARGDSECWSLEAIAGLIDPGEAAEETVRREALEEAGLEIGRLHKVYAYYPSPGAKSEYIYSFVAEADLPDSAAGLGGLLSEGEDIRAHVVNFTRLMELLESGEIENAPLILSALWLARHRERLRAAA